MNAAQWLPALITAGLIVSPGGIAGQISVGAKGGGTFANASFDDSFRSEARAGAIGGGFVTFPVGSRGSVQLEALYTQKGFSTVGFLVEGAAARISYMDIPILLKLRLTESLGRVRPSVMAGPFWGFELSCRTQGKIVETEGSDSCDGRFRRRGTADVGLIFGGNVDFVVADRLFFVIDGRYQHGLRNLHYDPESDGARSRAWSVMGGLGIQLGR